jgi:hypothetical protein
VSPDIFPGDKSRVDEHVFSAPFEKKLPVGEDKLTPESSTIDLHGIQIEQETNELTDVNTGNLSSK